MPEYVEFRISFGVIKVSPYTVHCSTSNDTPINRTQLPLIPAHALTIHKAQGATIKKGVVDLNFAKTNKRSWICDAAFYVAISRFPSLDSFVIKDYSPCSLRQIKECANP